MSSVPVAAFSLRGALVIGTDTGEWLSLTGDRLLPIPDARAPTPISDIADHGDGTLSVACWEPVLRQLRDGAWTDITIGSPATALAYTPSGLVIADTGGGLSRLAGTMPIQELTAPEPILQLVSMDGGLAALGASGSVEVTTWPGSEGGLSPVHTGSIGRAHALFPGLRRGTALVAGARGVGLLERARLASVTTDLGEKISGSAVFADRGRALLYADSGEAWIVDEGLARPARLRIGDAQIVGATPGADGTVLAWTSDGVLHIVGHDGASYRVTDGGVVLALPEQAGRVGSIAIHWTAAGGARVSRGHVAWN